jgi:hypothetical protein
MRKICNMHSLAAYEKLLKDYIHEVDEDTEKQFLGRYRPS